MSSATDDQPEPPDSSDAAQLSVAAARSKTKKCTCRVVKTPNWPPATIGAVAVAFLNVLLSLSLPWTRDAIFGTANPILWLAPGYVAPAVLLWISVSRPRQIPALPECPAVEKLGPYILKEKLGHGGMGEVYLAEHQLMKRHCAVKLIHSQHAEDRNMRQSFEREAKATAQLTHWNTIEIYDYGTADDGRFYYVMEYLKGVNLASYVKQYGTMTPGRVIYILKQLCDALHEADCAGLVHRDIKPSNVFLTERGQSYDIVKLLDFGLVQTITRNPVKLRNVSTKLHGSPSYMCPEQAVGLTPDARGDLYSLGAVAYFLLAGRPPFVDENPIMLVVAHATTSVPTFKEIGVDVPDDLAAVVLKCLARDPSGRYQSARKLREALESCRCSADWNWKSAEEWWADHSLSDAKPDDQAAEESEDTMQFSKDTNPQLAAAGQIDFDEPTAIFQKPEELQTA